MLRSQTTINARESSCTKMRYIICTQQLYMTGSVVWTCVYAYKTPHQAAFFGSWWSSRVIYVYYMPVFDAYKHKLYMLSLSLRKKLSFKLLTTITSIKAGPIPIRRRYTIYTLKVRLERMTGPLSLTFSEYSVFTTLQQERKIRKWFCSSQSL